MDAERFLRADVGRGDITTELTVPDTDGTARIVCEGDCTVAGISIVEDLFESAGVSVTPLVRDGDRYSYKSLTGEMIDAVVSIAVGDTRVTAEMRYDETLRYPLMYISDIC